MVHGIRSRGFHLNFHLERLPLVNGYTYHLVKVGYKQNLDCTGKDGTLTASADFIRSLMDIVGGDYLLTHTSV